MNQGVVPCHERGEIRTAWRPRADGMEELVSFVPGYVCTVPGPHNHGRHGMELRFVLRGPNGAAQFVFYTDWIPGERKAYRSPELSACFPMAVDLGYHARQPQYEGHTLMDAECYILGGQCYYDGSGLAAEGVLDAFIAHGESAVWGSLEGEYERLEYTP